MSLEDQSTFRLSQKSILDFLDSTGLPLMSRLTVVWGRLALVLAIANMALGIVTLCLVSDGLWRATLPWSGALPALVAAPLYLLSWRAAKARNMQSAARWMFWGLFLFTALMSYPHGALHPGWYLLPALSLVSTCCLGARSGFLLSGFAVAVLLAVPLTSSLSQTAADFGQAVWVHAASLSGLVLAGALAGALVHKLLHTALVNAEEQRQKQREAVAALRYREKLLRHAMRVETVGDLAGLVTHQLRNAFQVMLGHVSLGAVDEDGDSMRRLELVGETLQRSRPLLDQLMSLAHPEDGDSEFSDLNALLETFAERAARVMPTSVTLDFCGVDRALPILVNPRGLEHALWNLVINSRQAMPEGGALNLQCGVEDGQAFASVEDTGAGIPAEIQAKVFDPYFTTKLPGQGTGLGLAAVDRFVRASNGSVRLRSEPGAGTKLWLMFPLCEGLPPAAQLAATGQRTPTK